MTIKLTGILAAVVTPFNEDLSIDFEGIDRQVEHIVGNGIHGLVPGGSTGEFTTLSLEERKSANKRYVDAVAGRVPVLVGTGAQTTEETIELTRAAADDGADGVMVVPPYYDALSFDELLDHFRSVSEAVDLPIMYYNIPSNTGVELTPEQLARLGRETNVFSYKNTDDDFPSFTEAVLHHADDITALNGYDTLTFSALALGAQAGVWGAASILPAECRALFDAFADRDLDRARELWRKLQPVCVFLESHNYAAAIKAGTTLVGVPSGPVRKPVRPLSEPVVEEFRQVLRSAGVDVKA